MAGPLTGKRVIDLTWGITGPLATMLLADNGAEVIRVGRPSGDPFASHPGYVVWNRGKKSITLDLKRSEGRDVFKRLLEKADVLMESFQPGVADQLGIGYAALHERYPGLVTWRLPVRQGAQVVVAAPGCARFGLLASGDELPYQ